MDKFFKYGKKYVSKLGKSSQIKGCNCRYKMKSEKKDYLDAINTNKIKKMMAIGA